MDITMDCTRCEGRVAFHPGRGGGRRLLGNCASCASVFSLYGGRMSPVDPVVAEPERSRWSLTALVDRERRAAGA